MSVTEGERRKKVAALVSLLSRFAARRLRASALPSLNLKKKRDWSLFWTWSKQQGVINPWPRRQIDKKKKLTFVNASFWGKRAAVHRLRRPFNFDLYTYPPRTILRGVSRVSSLILRAKLWLAKKVLRHGNRFVARLRWRYFSTGEKRRPKTRLRFDSLRWSSQNS